MKAKHFKKLREKMQTYLIKRSYGMFGSFSFDLESYDEVMARNPKECVKRYCKRTHCTKGLNNFDETPEETNLTFATFRVLPKKTPFDRHVTYWN